jgi:hypothetical protein
MAWRKEMLRTSSSRLFLLACLLSPAGLAAQEGLLRGSADTAAARKSFSKPRPYSPYAGRNFPTRPLFGDTHLHTSFSMDAGAFGARIGPRDAYRLARGEEITASSGQPVKLSRPLDFLVVADHSDNMGFFPDLFAAASGTTCSSLVRARMRPCRSSWRSHRGRSRRT